MYFLQEKYQPPYDYTILTETFPTEFYQYETQHSVDASQLDESAEIKVEASDDQDSPESPKRDKNEMKRENSK